MYTTQHLGRENLGKEKEYHARTTISYEVLLLNLLEKAFEIRRRLSYTLNKRKIWADDFDTAYDYFEIIRTLHLALAPHLRTQELEEQIKKIEEKYWECRKEEQRLASELPQKIEAEIKSRKEKENKKKHKYYTFSYDIEKEVEEKVEEIIREHDIVCASRLVEELDKYIELYLETLDKHDLLLRKQEILRGGEK